MDEFLLQHADRHQHLIRQFQPKPRPHNGDPVTSPNIAVATRIRPLLDEETASGQVPAAFARAGECGSSSFHVGKVYGPDQNTELIYEDLVLPLLPWVWEGHVGTLFAYGQTGSGKTYSVSGIERLIAGALFDGTLEGQRKLYVSIFELAGNSAFDLLNTRAPFSILEDSFGNTQLAGAIEHEVTSTSNLLALIEESASFRQTASTEKNDGSSRTHAICRIRVQKPTQNPREDGVLYLVDLAGSEAARDIFNHSADRMKETREINTSLSTLKDCIRGLANLQNSKPSKKPYIPFRQSTLTKVLKHVFDPLGSRDCKTAVLACIGPSFLDTGATKNTLRYAEMLRSAEMKVVSSGYNPDIPSTWSNRDLRNYIKLKVCNIAIGLCVD
ncbi:P-loop containing nucleoside triphosphate hydrolase protein [Penicillium maclennaniae]|uniref:P-loop containing nucleoside triphosphate hydrolase protein n=1 Tax=Penicillium maclennaniae TaxID=1343394 RepID=UPI002540BD41|nr:P-loop containing nucleoside triphosphate hydrolase protein [Penicillium maclennaniae]KAJ5670612.1 P-loop containing nucleoside triphosphate hydrolase protein [Penicillium maclennaniae]